MKTQYQTQILLFDLPQKISDLLFHILDFNGKEYNCFNQNHNNENNDFLIIESSEITDVEKYAPTIVFIAENSNFLSQENYQSMLNFITAGGVLIYPEKNAELDKAVLQSSVYFRKFPFQEMGIYEQNGKNILQTDEFGEIFISLKKEQVGQNLQGVKFLVQQLGVMEQEFYEALSVY